MGVNGTSIVADATENIRNNVRVQTMSEIFDTGMLIITLLTTATTSRLKKQTEILAKQEKQVQIARQESLRANLLRAVSHDLRTPLTSIIGTTSSLLSDDSILSDAEKRELLENIENDSSWLLNMVENLLSVTRINDTVTHQVNKTPEIVEEVVAEAVQRLKKRFPSASIIVHVPTDYLLIPMDAILIEQVLINLLENALIHSGSSHSPELTVTDHPDHVTSDKCDRIAAQCEIQSEKRIGKEEIDTDYGENRRKEPVQVSVRISCNQDLGNNIK